MFSVASGSKTGCAPFPVSIPIFSIADFQKIGEISLMKEMTSVATTMMTDEEKAEIEKEMNGGTTPVAGEPAPPSTIHPDTSNTNTAPTTPASPEKTSVPIPDSLPIPGSPQPHPDATSSTSLQPHAPPAEGRTSPGSPGGSKKAAAADAKKRAKTTPEQRAKLQALDVERRKAMEERIELLTQKLIDKLRPIVDAKNPGDKDDPETVAFEGRIKREADDLKLESFGVEVRPYSVQKGFYMLIPRV